MESSKQRCWRHAILVFILCPLMVLADNKTFDADEVIERVLWKKTPITVTLIVGQERMVHFPDSVSVGIPQSLTPILQSQSINGTLYLTAEQAFESTRVVVRSEQAESIYVLDILARESSSQNTHLPALQVLTEHPSKGESTRGSAMALRACFWLPANSPKIVKREHLWSKSYYPTKMKSILNIPSCFQRLRKIPMAIKRWCVLPVRRRKSTCSLKSKGRPAAGKCFIKMKNGSLPTSVKNKISYCL